MKHWMFCCKDISEKISWAMDTHLPLNHRIMIRIHLIMCKHCMCFYRQLQQLRYFCKIQDIEQPDKQTALSPQAKEKIKDLLEQCSKK